MKKGNLYFLLLLAACSNRQDSGKLIGTYTAYHEHEFGKTNDTLIVSKPNKGANIYQIIRHSGVIRTVDGKVFPKKLVVDLYTASYDEQNMVLNELRTGKIFIWNDEKKQLILGTTQFVKLQ